MKRYKSLIFLGLLFIALSALLHYIHYLVFRDIHHIFIYLLGDLAFLPLEVFIVVIMIERVLAEREKRAFLNKLNMVIGVYFSEVGNYLLRELLVGFDKYEKVKEKFAVQLSWGHKDFIRAIKLADSLDEMPCFQGKDLAQLKSILVVKREFLLRLLENPNLLEHERFTDLLWATFHLTEELEARESLDGLPRGDVNHICSDIRRVYRNLLAEWLDYVEHLRKNYPYLFSLVVRTHPFQAEPSAIVE